ncbi:MAG: tetratricopeptide repeat protein [Cyanothece sp. SIO2G6]|nr:tetratricopeptide repeat protein [Cyanothece sp. SIO2G6]
MDFLENSNLPLIYLGILIGLLAIAAIFLFRQVLKTRRVETTFNRLQRKLTQEKGTAQEYYELGSIYLDKRLYAPAIDLFKRALKAKDLEGAENIALIYNALGYTYASQDQFDLAIKQYKESLEQRPDYVTALNNLGFAYEQKQLIAQAVEAYDQVLQYEPQNKTAKRRSESLRKRLVPSNSTNAE